MEIIFIRTIILFIISFTIIRLMGKRQLGELEPFEVVITIMIAEIAMTPMNDIKTSLFYGIIPILALFIIHTLISFLSLKSFKLRKLFCGKETILIDKGTVIIENLRKNDYTMDELCEQLREKDIFHLEKIEYAIIESSGNLSILLKDENPKHMPIVILTCGTYIEKAKIDSKSFEELLKKLNYNDVSKIFYASLSPSNVLFIQEFGKTSNTFELGDNPCFVK